MTDRLARALNMNRGELPLALLAVGFHFCVLCGYFFLRPVRDAMGVSRGMDDLRWLFILTSFVSLGLVLAFGGIVAKTNRRKFIPIAYLFVIVCLIAFSGLLVWDGFAGGGLIGSDAETTLSRGVGYSFYVWLSAINLFTTSVFWAFMVDVFDVDQGKRLFAFIGIGGTLGALLGGTATTAISSLTTSVFLPAGLMMLGATFFAVGIMLMLVLDRAALASTHSRLTANASSPRALERTESAAIGGTFWDGLRAVVTSPYLLGIGVWIIFMAISNTMIYFTQANIVLTEADTFSQRVAGFAFFDALAQFMTLLTQMFITTHLIRRIGIGWTLAILPLVTMAGFAILSIWTVYGVMALFQAIHRATRYAVSRPSRETLFSVVPASEKYKAKPVVDVFLYRGGDVAGVGVDGLFAALGFTLPMVAMATAPIAGVWGLLSIRLGRAQQAQIEDVSATEDAAVS
ncbi:MAG: Npt1/Npt2 family nucleotide transporter [Gemmatimonadota bacterium]|nr:Npt1/Npt2 family nucleotide transporter [Gemmatimonadota bacterium]MDE3014213.1 Npt1/Npt2 family nucleotide transporter [Gemmatimonadota bacterium]